MSKRDLIKSNITSIVKFESEHNRSRELSDIYITPSREKERIYYFLNERVLYKIYGIVESLVDKYDCNMYISASGCNRCNTSTFNYAIRYRIYHRRFVRGTFLNIVFTKNYMYVMFDNEPVYRFCWGYSTDFDDIFRNRLALPEL